MIAPLIPDDGLRNRARWQHGTNKRFPCGHDRSPDNITSEKACRLCRRRIDRASARRRRAA